MTDATTGRGTPLVSRDESDAFAYWGPLYAPDPYRSSDHDPLVVVIQP